MSFRPDGIDRLLSYLHRLWKGRRRSGIHIVDSMVLLVLQQHNLRGEVLGHPRWIRKSTLPTSRPSGSLILGFRSLFGRSNTCCHL